MLGSAEGRKVKLIVCEVIFEEFQRMSSQSTNVTDRQTDNLQWQYRATLRFAGRWHMWERKITKSIKNINMDTIMTDILYLRYHWWQSGPATVALCGSFPIQQVRKRTHMDLIIAQQPTGTISMSFDLSCPRAWWVVNCCCHGDRCCNRPLLPPTVVFFPMRRKTSSINIHEPAISRSV